MEKYFKEAIKQAKKALSIDEIPVGAVIVKDNKIIGRGFNDRETKNNPLGHAEINAIIKATKKIKDWRLNDCEIYVTLEPCKMCEEVIKESRINKVYYLLPRKNNAQNNVELSQTYVCEEEKNEYKIMLENFFKKLRIKS